MDHLLQPNCNISGEIFYITDGNPTSTDFVSEPLKKFSSKHNLFSKLISNIPFLPMQIPKPIAVVYSSLFSFLSLLVGKQFRMPIWGFTPMELKKVNIFL